MLGQLLSFSKYIYIYIYIYIKIVIFVFNSYFFKFYLNYKIELQ
ncbi:hypothetical protein ACMBCM_08435 [Spiroplasma sp. K1]